MKPPVCSICRKDFRNKIQKGGFVYFKLSKEDRIVNKKNIENKILTHPRDVAWFCDKHLEIARKYRKITLQEAYIKIVKELEIDKTQIK